MTVRNIIDKAQFDTLADSSQNVIVAHFWAPWSEACLQMDEVFSELSQSKEFESITFVKIEAEAVPEISAKFNIIAVPTFVFIKSAQSFDRLDGVYPVELKKKLLQCTTMVKNGGPEFSSAQQEIHPPSKSSETSDLNSRLKRLINSYPCMVFMKGNATEPRCGFSKQLIALLNQTNADYKTFDILSDEEVRTGLKEYSQWPTYPQVYVRGELIGGLDIVKELLEANELQDKLPKKQSLDDQLKSLINKAAVMVFMKGDRHEPKCGFSRTLVQILNEIDGVKYETFDILQDETVRQALKTYSNWPTYPQVYVKGELIGGLDIIKEMQSSGDLKSVLSG